MSKEKKDFRFPRTLYKSGGPCKWGTDKYYSETIVKDETEQEVAEKNGFIDSFQDALFGNVKSVDMTKAEIMEALDDLGVEYDNRAKKDVLADLLKESKEEN